MMDAVNLLPGACSRVDCISHLLSEPLSSGQDVFELILALDGVVVLVYIDLLTLAEIRSFQIFPGQII
jgi:hypothetical protein